MKRAKNVQLSRLDRLVIERDRYRRMMEADGASEQTIAFAVERLAEIQSEISRVLANWWRK